VYIDKMGPFYSILFTLLPTVTIASVWEKYKKIKIIYPFNIHGTAFVLPSF